MKLGRFVWNSEVRYGVIDGDQILSISGEIFGRFDVGARVCALKEVHLLPPVESRSIIGVGINYPRRVEQHYSNPTRTQRYQNPLIFLMPTSSVIGHLDPIVFPAIAEQVDAAGELVVVMKQRAKRISESEARDYILGYTCGNDLASGDLGQADLGQPLRAHGFDTSTVLGPFIQTDVSPDRLAITLRINGEIASQGNTAEMIYPVERIVSHITQFMTLYPGDTVFMGTPMGAPVRVGDVVEVEIEGIGLLKNEVIRS